MEVSIGNDADHKPSETDKVSTGNGAGRKQVSAVFGVLGQTPPRIPIAAATRPNGGNRGRSSDRAEEPDREANQVSIFQNLLLGKLDAQTKALEQKH